MNRIVTYVSTAAIVLLLCAPFAGANGFTLTWNNSAAPSTNLGVINDYIGTATATQAWEIVAPVPHTDVSSSTSVHKLVQTFLAPSNMTMDKFATQLRASAGTIVMSAVANQDLKISLYQMDSLTDYTPTVGKLLTSWTSTLPVGSNTNISDPTTPQPGTWLTFDFTENYNLLAGVQYGVSFEWAAENTSGHKMWLVASSAKDDPIAVPPTLSPYQGGGVGLYGKFTPFNSWVGGGYGGRDLDFAVIVPEPATMVLLSLGSLLLFRRKQS